MRLLCDVRIAMLSISSCLAMTSTSSQLLASCDLGACNSNQSFRDCKDSYACRSCASILPGNDACALSSCPCGAPVMACSCRQQCSRGKGRKHECKKLGANCGCGRYNCPQCCVNKAVPGQCDTHGNCKVQCGPVKWAKCNCVPALPPGSPSGAACASVPPNCQGSCSNGTCPLCSRSLCIVNNPGDRPCGCCPDCYTGHDAGMFCQAHGVDTGACARNKCCPYCNCAHSG